MEEGFASPTNIAWNGHTGTVEYGGGDKGMVAMFYNRPIHSPGKSTKEGRPIYEDKIYVRIHPPGERLNIIDREANVSDQRRWPAQWHQFSQNKQQQPEGTPIDMLYPEYPSIAAMLRASAVSTIEQCADLSAPAIENIGMGCQRYVNDAKKYIEAANKGLKGSQVRHELDELARENRVLQKTISDLKAQLEDLRNSGGVGGGVSPEQIQAALAGLMGRPQYPQVANQRPSGFDAQAAMINATSATAQVQQVVKPRRRARPRVTG